MHILRQVIAASACLFLLQACGPLSIRDEARGAYVPMQLGTFTLHKDVTIRADHTRATLQDGTLASGVNQFKPHCQLEVNTLLTTPQTVKADVFTITHITTRMHYVVQSAPLQLAALDGFTLAHSAGSDGNGDSEPWVMYAFHFRLHSDRQPDVRALRCGGMFDAPGLAERPTLQEIAVALGAYGTLTLK